MLQNRPRFSTSLSYSKTATIVSSFLQMYSHTHLHLLHWNYHWLQRWLVFLLLWHCSKRTISLPSKLTQQMYSHMLQALTIKNQTNKKQAFDFTTSNSLFLFIRVNGTTCNISNSISEFKLISCSRSDPEPPSGCHYACPLVPFFLCQGEISPHRAGTLTGHCCLKQLGGQCHYLNKTKLRGTTAILYYSWQALSTNLSRGRI